MIGLAAANTAAQLYQQFFAGPTEAEKAAKAQTERLTQQSDLHKMLQGIFDKPNQGFQSDALSAALADKNLMGMAPGFARMQLVKQMLGIGGGGTGALDSLQAERAAQAASAQQAGEALGMLLNQSSDPGPSGNYNFNTEQWQQDLWNTPYPGAEPGIAVPMSQG
jgi:hypothetical protein